MPIPAPMALPNAAQNFMPIFAKFAMLRDANHRAFHSVQNALSSDVNPPLIGPLILNPNGPNRAVSQPDGSTAPSFVLVFTSSGVAGLG